MRSAFVTSSAVTSGLLAGMRGFTHQAAYKATDAARMCAHQATYEAACKSENAAVRRAALEGKCESTCKAAFLLHGDLQCMSPGIADG